MIIPCAGTGRPAELAAELLQQQPAPAAVLVVGAPAAGVQLPAGAQLVAAAGLSAAAARNHGAATAATADVLIFVDADVAVAPGWLAALLAAHSVQPTALISAALRLDDDGYWRRCDHRLAYAPLLVGQQRAPRWLPAMSLLVPARLWRQLGGFDETFDGAAGEDIDFCRRAVRAGAGLAVAPAAQIAHHARRHTAAALWRHQFSFGAIQRRLDAADGGHLRQTAAASLSWPLAAVIEALLWQLRTPGGRWSESWGLVLGRLAWYRGYYSS